MNPFSPVQLKSVLCLGAHADDIEIGCGGTLLRLLSEHPEVHIDWVVLSGSEPRKKEAEASALAWLDGHKSKRIELLDFRDSYFPAHWSDLKDYFHDLARRADPQMIFTHFHQDGHQDHRVVAELTACAFRNHSIFEYEIPKFDGDLRTPNCYVEVSDEHAERKISLLQTGFPSQAGKPWYDAETFRGLLRLRGLECHSASRWAEGFHVRKFCVGF